MKRLFFILFLFFATHFYSQNPGNIGTANLTGWWKPDALALGNVTVWTTTFPTGVNSISVFDNTAPYPVAIISPGPFGVSNYNTTIDFNTNSNAAIKALQNTNSLNLLDNRNSTSQGTFFGVYFLPPSVRPINNHMMLYNETSGDAIQFRNLGTTGRFALGRGLGTSTNATRNWVENFLPSIISYKGNRSGATSLVVNENSKLVTTSSASQSSGPIGLHFGLMPGNANSPFIGYLNEFIFYNRDLSLLEMNKIHSYLAIKYGITLDNTGGGTQGDYLSSGGKVIWDATLSPGYHHHVVGLARNDNQALHQKQSHTVYDTTRIYVGTLSPSSAGNTNSINNDSSFIMIGNNNTVMCSTIATINESPSTVYIDYRLMKEYKVTKTNFTDTISIEYRTGGGAGCLPIYNSINLNCMALLVDDDGDFTNATIYNKTDGITFSSTPSGLIVASGITNSHIPNDSTVYITFASATLNKNLGQDILKCDEDTVVLDAGHPGASYLWSDGSTNQTLSALDSGIYWVQVSSLGCMEADTITIREQIIEANFNPIDTSGCVPLLVNFRDLSSINSGSITTWAWDFGDGNTALGQNQSHAYTIPGLYTVRLGINTNLGCLDDTIKLNQITVHAYAVADFDFTPAFTNTRELVSYSNFSANANSYKWYFGDGDSSVSTNPTHEYLEEGLYEITLIAMNAFGCNDTITKTIEIKDELYFIPNSFTPYPEGNNQEWGFVGLKQLEDFELLVFDRWGELVFESTDPTKFWDGKYEKELCPQGVYIWKARMKFKSGKIIEKIGHVNLVR